MRSGTNRQLKDLSPVLRNRQVYSWPLDGLIRALCYEVKQAPAKTRRHVLFLFRPLFRKLVGKRGRAALLRNSRPGTRLRRLVAVLLSA
jgi:hypothetical protein